MKSNHKMEDWLPITNRELRDRGWERPDVIIISGDAYVDHPSFGHAVIARVLEKEGLNVAIIPQPNWQDDLRDFRKFGAPRLFFGVTAGCMDSMINHYTAAKRLRSDDAYTPGGKSGFRPDYAATVYSRILKDLYPDIPVILGGIEASMRRLTHYDYWSDALKPSILAESKADMLVYGMGEQPVREIARLLKRGVPISSLATLPQTAVIIPAGEKIPENKKWETVELASYESCRADKKTFASTFKTIETESNRVSSRRIIQKTGGETVVVNPPFPTMTEKEMDASFDLPYTRLPHPKYRKRGIIPAYEMIKHSITLHRGCFGGCSFCAISGHQGKFVASRSKESIMKEVDEVTAMADFKGYISDLGGPSANMYRMKGNNEKACRSCSRPSCIYPSICRTLNTDHRPLTEIYRAVSANKKVKKAFVASGLRYDLFFGRSKEEDKKNGCSEYMEDLILNHVSGRLKVAPEHSSERVLKMMRKPSFRLFRELKKRFDEICATNSIRQQIIPYFISGHPGCELKDMENLAEEVKDLGFKLEQVQDFTPTPMTLATVIYYSGFDPFTMAHVYSARNKKEKMKQREMFFPKK